MCSVEKQPGPISSDLAECHTEARGRQPCEDTWKISVPRLNGASVPMEGRSHGHRLAGCGVTAVLAMLFSFGMPSTGMGGRGHDSDGDHPTAILAASGKDYARWLCPHVTPRGGGSMVPERGREAAYGVNFAPAARSDTRLHLSSLRGMSMLYLHGLVDAAGNHALALRSEAARTGRTGRSRRFGMPMPGGKQRIVCVRHGGSKNILKSVWRARFGTVQCEPKATVRFCGSLRSRFSPFRSFFDGNLDPGCRLCPK